MRHTKIIATIGPASDNAEVITALILAGVNVFRLNFSHGSQESHGATITRIREGAAALDRQVAILQDLSGPKIRTGLLVDGQPLPLARGDALEIRIGSDVGGAGIVSTTYAPLAAAVKPGDHLLIDDGKIELEVQAAGPHAIATRVVDGGLLGEHKGINAPNVPLPSPGLTEKDERDLRFGLAAGVDLVALSFVQTVADLNAARAVAQSAGRPGVPIIAKLERPEAIKHLSEICAAADALMVARGDLGLELPLEQVPQVQKQVLRIGRERGVPVIVATQVLESMRSEPRPTRAEVSDAAGAVDAGADAIMLSGETAVGEYPVRAVQVLDSVIRHAESVPPVWTLAAPFDERPDHLPPLADAAVTLAARARADALIAFTRKGRTARLLAARRPGPTVFAVTDAVTSARPLCLWWGVEPILENLSDRPDHIIQRVVARLQSQSRLPTPATVVIASGSPELEGTDVNFVRLRKF